MQRSLRIGTRGSKLALAQTAEFRDKLSAVQSWSESDAANLMETIVIRTQGDRVQTQDLTLMGGKGLFVKDLEAALADGRIDVAVHSIKDMLPQLREGLELAAVLPRADPHDALFLHKGEGIQDLAQGASFGTSSPRRKAQILALRPDLKVVPLRGNVDTRIAKIKAGEIDSTILAMAGLSRLGQQSLPAQVMLFDQMLPAVAQGAIGLQIREDDLWTREQIGLVNDVATQFCITVERSFLEVLDGTCRAPIAGLAEIVGEDVLFRGQVLDPRGTQVHNVQQRAACDPRDLDQARDLGSAAGTEMLALAGPAALNI